MAEREHISSPDCWCKPKVTKTVGGQTIEHRDVAYEQRRPGTGRGRKAA